MPPSFYVLNCVKYTSFFFFFFGGGNLQNLFWNLFKVVVCQTNKLETKTQLGQMSWYGVFVPQVARVRVNFFKLEALDRESY